MMTDWQAIAADYIAGVGSVRAIAKKHGLTEGAIRKVAKKYGWEDRRAMFIRLRRLRVEAAMCGLP
jgi:transposase-like protein